MPLKPPPAPAPAAVPAGLDQSELLGLVGYNCRRAYLSVVAGVVERLSGHGLSPAEFSVLSVIGGNPGSPQRAIADALAIAPPNLARLLDGLAARGLVERLPHPQDRRAQALHLTARGRRAAREALRAVQAAERDALAGLEPAERASLIALLQRLFRPGD